MFDDCLRTHPTCRGMRAPLAGTRGVRYQTLPKHRILQALPRSVAAPTGAPTAPPVPKASPAAAAAAATTAAVPSNASSISFMTHLSTTNMSVELPVLVPEEQENAASSSCLPQRMLQGDKVVRLSSAKQLGLAALANDAMRRPRVEFERAAATPMAGVAQPRNTAMPRTAACFIACTPRTSSAEPPRNVAASACRAARACSAEPLRTDATSPLRCRTALQNTASATVTGVQCTRHSLEVGDLHFAGTGPDLTQPYMLQQLLGSVGGTSGTVEKLTGFQGGLNDGIWILHEAGNADGPPQDWILKVVTATKKASNLPTEAQNVLRLANEHPGILSDPLLAFPKAMLSCVNVAGGKTHDLLVMRKARGERLCEVFARKWHTGQRDECWRIVEKVGTATASIHRRYANIQHGDLQPANIFWDESSGCITILDIGGMGMATCDDDVQHFTRALRLLATSYGSDFERDGVAAFQRGYHAGCR